MITEHKFYVRRRKDRGYHLIKVFVHWDGLPEFAIQCVPILLIDMYMQQLIYFSDEPWEDWYNVWVLDVLKQSI